MYDDAVLRRSRSGLPEGPYRQYRHPLHVRYHPPPRTVTGSARLWKGEAAEIWRRRRDTEGLCQLALPRWLAQRPRSSPFPHPVGSGETSNLRVRCWEQFPPAVHLPYSRSCNNSRSFRQCDDAQAVTSESSRNAQMATTEPQPRFKLELRDADSSSPTAPPKKKQKRNKPTLSCEECVERKTKVSPAPSAPSMSCADRRAPGASHPARVRGTTRTDTG